MKKYLILSMLMIAVVGVQAQSVQVGIKGALNFSNLKSDNDQWLSSSNRTGYQVGVWTRFGNIIHVQPELYLSGKSSQIEFAENSGNVKADVSFTSLDLPVLLGTRLGFGPVALRLQAGPMMSFVVDKNIGEAFSSIADFDNYKNNSLNIVAGAGVDIGKIRGDLRYERSMNSLSKDSTPDQKLGVWSIGVGLRLF